MYGTMCSSSLLKRLKLHFRFKHLLKGKHNGFVLLSVHPPVCPTTIPHLSSAAPDVWVDDFSLGANDQCTRDVANS